MTGLGHNRHVAIIAIAAVLAFAAAQMIVTVHATKFGDKPHLHGGQACVLSLAPTAGDKFTAGAFFVLFVAVAAWRAEMQFSKIERAQTMLRVRRARGPPGQ